MPRKRNSTKSKDRARAKARTTTPGHPRPTNDTFGNRIDLSHSRSHGIHTLAEEARNTASNRHGNRGRDARLRHQPVSFVSAGFLDPLKLLGVRDQSAQPVLPSEAGCISTEAGNIVTDIIQSNESGEPSARLPGTSPVARPEQAPSEERHDDPGLDCSSDSSEEVILFKGRNAGFPEPKPPSLSPLQDNAPKSVKRSLPLQVADETTNERLDYIPLDAPRPRRPRRSRQPRRSTSRKPHSMMRSDDDDDDDEAAIIADYIANMQGGFGIDENEEIIDRGDGTDSDGAEHPGVGSYGFSVLRDLGGTDSDAIPGRASSGDESTGYSDHGQNLESADERLARSIARREQLGLESEDELFLDGECASDDEDDDGWVPAPKVAPRRKKGASKKSKLFQKGSQFPSATQMAEAFDAMDLMDLQNARLQHPKKGVVSFGLSDSELEDAMNVAIKKDRRKKADKKKAREELRSQGLLGKNADLGDLRIKYRAGMSLDDLADEVEAFLLGTQEQLILPPLDKHARMAVHTIANSLRIKSKSAGTGVGRHPVLYRSKATPLYDQDNFDTAFSRVRRTWFPRLDVDRKIAQQARVLRAAEAPLGKGRRNARSSLVLQEGQVVGQHAAELGVENKGRAMLEKMGWSKGMSLGTGETKGIIVPLTHVVKKSKAGLGEI